MKYTALFIAYIALLRTCNSPSRSDVDHAVRMNMYDVSSEISRKIQEHRSECECR